MILEPGLILTQVPLYGEGPIHDVSSQISKP